MHILFIAHNFAPEFGGGATMQDELSRHLAARGHQVTVITIVPLHHMVADLNAAPAGETVVDGVRIVRLKVPQWNRTSFVLRVLHDLFVDFLLCIKSLLARRADVVFVMSPPLTLPLSAWVVKVFKGGRTFLYLQDIFPELVVSMGLRSRKDLSIRAAELLEHFIYWSADYLAVHSPKNRQHVINHGGCKSKVQVVPLWVDTELVRPQARDNEFALVHGLIGKFVIMYSGTIGYAVGLGIIPQAAELLAADSNILIVVAGAGSRQTEMAAEIERRSLKNVVLLPVQPREQFPLMLASADVLLVMLRKEPTGNSNGYFNAVVPHKLLSSMASGRPVLVSAESGSDTAGLVRKADCGMVAAAEDPHELAKAILDMKNDPQRLQQMGRKGREFACKYFSSARAVASVEQLLLGLERREIRVPENPWES